jgi:hypothetical protein
MTSGNPGPAPAFKLKQPGDYFGPKTAALVAAALQGDEAGVRQALAQGANANEDGPSGAENRIRPLHYAVAANSPRAAQLLFQAGGDPELDTAGFGRPLLFPLILDNPAMLAQLLELRPVARLSPQTVQMLLFRAVELSRPRCLAVLLQRGVPVDLPDSVGATAFMEAMAAQDYDLAEWLLQQGAAVTRPPTEAGFTPANVLQFHLARLKPGTPTHQKLAQMQTLMQSRGAVFPAPTPQEIRAERGRK